MISKRKSKWLLLILCFLLLKMLFIELYYSDFLTNRKQNNVYVNFTVNKAVKIGTGKYYSKQFVPGDGDTEEWQVLESSNGSFYLYGAYLDVRANNRLGPTVRVLGMINRLEPQVKTQCQLWFSDSPGTEPVVSKVLEYKYIWYKKWGNYKQGLFQPYLLACQLPKTHWGKTPVSVSIVENKCDKATNNLRVTYNKPEEGEGKKKFAVCVKGLDFPEDDLSIRLTEWIEVLGSLGADKIFLYNLEVHPNITKVRCLHNNHLNIEG